MKIKIFFGFLLNLLLLSCAAQVPRSSYEFGFDPLSMAQEFSNPDLESNVSDTVSTIQIDLLAHDLTLLSCKCEKVTGVAVYDSTKGGYKISIASDKVHGTIFLQPLYLDNQQYAYKGYGQIESQQADGTGKLLIAVYVKPLSTSHFQTAQITLNYRIADFESSSSNFFLGLVPSGIKKGLFNNLINKEFKKFLRYLREVTLRVN